jgi:predicted transcriptional regulator
MGGKQRIVRRRWKLLDIIVDILKMNKRYKYKKEHISYTDRAALHNYVYYFSKVGKKNISGLTVAVSTLYKIKLFNWLVEAD